MKPSTKERTELKTLARPLFSEHGMLAISECTTNDVVSHTNEYKRISSSNAFWDRSTIYSLGNELLFTAEVSTDLQLVVVGDGSSIPNSGNSHL